jgi:hypothetical protein
MTIHLRIQLNEKLFISCQPQNMTQIKLVDAQLQPAGDGLFTSFHRSWHHSRLLYKGHKAERQSDVRIIC